jgi:hypothetical protein
MKKVTKGAKQKKLLHKRRGGVVLHNLSRPGPIVLFAKFSVNGSLAEMSGSGIQIM